MTSEPFGGSFSNEALWDAIERYPLAYYDPDTGQWYEPGDTGWVARYDLYGAAADVLEEKAAAVAGEIDYTDQGASYKAGALSDKYLRMAQTYRSRSQPRSVSVVRSDLNA